MRAVVVDRDHDGGLRVGEVDAPVARPDEALVEVRAISLNPGEISVRLPAAADGSIPGWETSGVVVEAASDGSGPAVGSAVVGFGDGGGWAQYRALPTSRLGVMEPTVDLAQASTLPIAAASALRGIREFGGVVGTRLLVTGASGAVGRFAVQLGALAGADVVAVARDGSRHDDLRFAGAREVYATTDGVRTSVHNVIDTVGGNQLVDGFRLLRSRGTVISVGRASGDDITFAPGDLVADVGRTGLRLRTYFLGEDLSGYSDDLEWLGRQLGAARLTTDVAERIRLSDIPSRVREPLHGKVVAVLDHIG